MPLSLLSIGRGTASRHKKIRSASPRIHKDGRDTRRTSRLTLFENEPRLKPQVQLKCPQLALRNLQKETYRNHK